MKKDFIKPNLIIPGFPKSGTSSLFDYINKHPQVFGKKKEPHTYSIQQHYIRRFDPEYENSFANLYAGVSNEKYILEASTSYMITKPVAERIARDTPNCKLIIVARDPIERIFSHFNWLRSLKLVDKSFKKEIKEWNQKPFNIDVHFYGNYKNYVESSKYGQQLKNYLKYFSKEQICFFSLEELKAEPQKTLNQVWDFLEIERIKLSEMPVVNATKEKVIRDFTPKKIRKLLSFIPDYISLRIRTKILNRFYIREVKPKKVSQKDILWIYEFLREDLRTLEEIGYKSPYWKSVKIAESVHKNNENV